MADWAGTVGEPAENLLARFSFLDLYAGSGAVALEAASRGAGPVAAVEADRATAALIGANARATRLAVEVHPVTVAAFLAGPATPFDIVWLDPPYDLPSPVVAAVVARVAEVWLAADGLVVVERSRRDDAFVWPSRFVNQWSRRYGETTLFFASQEAS